MCLLTVSYFLIYPALYLYFAIDTFVVNTTLARGLFAQLSEKQSWNHHGLAPQMDKMLAYIRAMLLLSTRALP